MAIVTCSMRLNWACNNEKELDMLILFLAGSQVVEIVARLGEIRPVLTILLV